MKEAPEQAAHLLRDAPRETWTITSILALIFILVVYGDVIAGCWKTFWDTVLSTTENYNTDASTRRK